MSERELIQDLLPAYEVGGELGRGAFGIVYEARHSQLGRQVAIKQLSRIFASDPAVRARFVAEARMVAALDHPHIVPVYDFVDHEDGLCLIVMEQCAGSVSERFTGQGVGTDEACAAVLACCAALEFAHSAGVLHRDIKPENLLYDTKGVIKLGDFGIARALDTSAQRTATGTVIGTPAYMSPEQVRGEELTAASDVYSAGIMAYELLSGSFPFPGSTSATGFLAHHLVTPPTPLIECRPELPGAIGAVIDRALSKDLAERQQSALELATELTRAGTSAFGAGWIRDRGFVLHWPEVISESERQAPGGAASDAINVRADASRTQLAGPRGGEGPTTLEPTPPSAPVRPEGGSGDRWPAPTASPTRIVGSAPSDQPTPPGRPLGSAAPTGTADTPTTDGRQAPTSDLPASGPPPARDLTVPGPPAASEQPWSTGPAGGPPPGAVNPAPEASSGGGMSKGVVIALGVLGLFVVLILGLAVIGLVAGDDDDGTTSATGDDGQPLVATTSVDGIDGSDSTAFTLPITPVPAVAPVVNADSPFTPTPCPVEQERIACLLGVALTDGEMIAAYEVFGFIPELEPVDYHLHFYLDTAVDGDERKAGTEVAGGSWRPWDGLLPFTTTGGENGRIGFTQDDVVASGARHLCVIVADPEQRAIPGSGNCAPIPYVFDDEVALEQVNRLLGTYAGRCAIGATLVIPEGWQWVDLVENDAAEAARILRPGDVENATGYLGEFISAGGILIGDGPLDNDYIVNLGVWRVEGDFTAADDPATVEAELARRELTFDGVVTEKTFGGRTINTQVVLGDGFELTQYVVPDFGYALILNFFAPDAAAWTDTSDAVAATLMGC